jgi:hypothetical protein
VRRDSHVTRCTFDEVPLSVPPAFPVGSRYCRGRPGCPGAELIEHRATNRHEGTGSVRSDPGFCHLGHALVDIRPATHSGFQNLTELLSPIFQSSQIPYILVMTPCGYRRFGDICYLHIHIMSAVSKLSRLVAGFPPRWLGFELASSPVGSVMDRAALGNVFTGHYGFPCQSFIPLIAP